MRLNGLRLELILVVFAVVALTAFGMQWAVDRLQVDRPLLQAATRVPGVPRAALVDDGGRKDLVVTLGPTADFRAAYSKLGDLLTKAFGKDAGRVVVKDSRTPRLSRALYEMNFALQEGLATGKFTDMRTAVVATAHRLNLPDPYLWVDGERIYLGLRDGKSALFALVERDVPATGTAPAEGGGAVG